MLKGIINRNLYQHKHHVPYRTGPSESRRIDESILLFSFRFPEGISIDESTKSYEYCVFCQQQQQSSSLVPPIIASPTTPTTPPTPTTPMTPTTTTINVVIDQQTIEQLIQESLRKLLYPAFVG